MERKLKNKYILISVMFTLALALSSVILDLFLKESGFSYFTINKFDLILTSYNGSENYFDFFILGIAKFI